MRDLAILADDLTGALDSAGVFSSRDRSVEVTWTGPVSGDCSVDSESRSGEAEVARAKVSALLPFLAESRISFKKIDSLLRGNSFAELAACIRLGAFDAIVVAPAFPAQRRMTVGGALVVDGRREVSIADGLAGEGIHATVLPAGVGAMGLGVFICDANTDDDLVRLVRLRQSGRVLWCGSSGLARALAGKPPPYVPLAPSLAIIGSRHPASRRHAAGLSEGLAERAVSAASEDAAEKVERFLGDGGHAALIMDFPEMPPREAEARYRDTFLSLARTVASPGALIVVGGDTLLRLMQALGASSLVALGERAPGLPVSRVRGGGWDGCLLVSKSGAFGDSGMFSEFMQGELQSA